MLLTYNTVKGKYTGIGGNSKNSIDDFIFKFEDIDTLEFGYVDMENGTINQATYIDEQNIEHPFVFHVGQDTGFFYRDGIVMNDYDFKFGQSINYISKITLKNCKVIELALEQFQELYYKPQYRLYYKVNNKKIFLNLDLIQQFGSNNIDIWSFYVIDLDLNIYYFDFSEELSYIKFNIITNQKESHGLGLLLD